MRKEIEARIDELSREIRAYPAPIARCDEQLAGLIEERALLIAKLRILEAQTGCSPLATWTNDGGFHGA